MTDLITAAQQVLNYWEQVAWGDAVMADKMNALRAALAEKREHVTDGSPCWCNPETTYVDPDTGASVIVHKEPQ